LLQCQSLFSCFFFLFAPQAITCHWWCVASKWVNKAMHGYQQYVKCSNRSIWIIIHVQNSQFGGCCNAHYWFAVASSYVTQRPSFVTGA
jgi:hypothetical protein